MMNIRITRIERMAGIFVAVSVAGAFVFALSLSLKNGWLSTKTHFQAYVESAEGIHPGTAVQISGLRAGAVSEVDIESASRIRLEFYVYDRFRDKIRDGTRVQILRPFLIGEKVIEVALGPAENRLAKENSVLPTEPSFDVVDLVSGKKIAPFLSTLESLTRNLKELATAFADPKRTQSFVRTFDQIEPLARNLNTMAAEMTKISKALNKDKKIESITINLAELTEDLNKMSKDFSAESPSAGKDLAALVKNMGILADEMKKLTPTLNAVAPELPQVSRRGIEALNEAVVVLKAMQKSFLLRSSVSEVKEEESKREPASRHLQQNFDSVPLDP